MGWGGLGDLPNGYHRSLVYRMQGSNSPTLGSGGQTRKDDVLSQRGGGPSCLTGPSGQRGSDTLRESREKQAAFQERRTKAAIKQPPRSRLLLEGHFIKHKRTNVTVSTAIFRTTKYKRTRHVVDVCHRFRMTRPVDTLCKTQLNLGIEDCNPLHNLPQYSAFSNPISICF